MLPCCHHKIPHFSVSFQQKKNVCIICSLRAIFYRVHVKWEATATDCYIYDNDSRHSFIWFKRGRNKKWRGKFFFFSVFPFMFHSISSINFPTMPNATSHRISFFFAGCWGGGMQRRNNAIKKNSQQRHANNNKKEKTSAKYLYDYYGNLSEVAAASSTSLPLTQSHVSVQVKCKAV